MANKLYEESSIQNIANAIRTKNGQSTLYTVAQMPAAIQNIPTQSEPLPSISLGSKCDEYGIYHGREDWETLAATPGHSDEYAMCAYVLDAAEPYVSLLVTSSNTLATSNLQIDITVDGTPIDNTTITSRPTITYGTKTYIKWDLTELKTDSYITNLTSEEPLIIITISPLAVSNIHLTTVGTNDYSTTKLNLNNTCKYVKLRLPYCTAPRWNCFYTETYDGIICNEVSASTSITMYRYLWYCTNLQKARFGGFSGKKLNNFAGFLQHCHKLSDITYVDGNVEYSNENFKMPNVISSNATTLSSMFSSCYCLKSIDVSNWDVANITTFAGTFASCYNLQYVKGLDTWGQALKCTTVGSMFSHCSKLMSEINLSGLKLGTSTAKLTDVSYMFQYCYRIPKINISNISFANVTTMAGMFMCATGCTEILMNNIVPPTSACTSFNYLFQMCNVKEVDLSGWDMSNSYLGINMFQLNSRIKRLDFTNVTPPTKTYADTGSSNGSFANLCDNLTYLNVSNINFDLMTGSSSYYHRNAFQNCFTLVDFYPPQNIYKMFNLTGCYALSHDSLLRVIDNLTTVSTSTKLILGDYNLAKLTADEIAVATAKGWTVTAT